MYYLRFGPNDVEETANLKCIAVAIERKNDWAYHLFK